MSHKARSRCFEKRLNQRNRHLRQRVRGRGLEEEEEEKEKEEEEEGEEELGRLSTASRGTRRRGSIQGVKQRRRAWRREVLHGQARQPRGGS